MATKITSIGMAGKGASVTVSGTAETVAALARLSAQLQKKIVGNAIRSGARVILKEARLRCPVETGALAASLKVRAPKKKAAGENIAMVSADPKFVGPDGYRRPYKYAWLVEHGSSPHTIESKDIPLNIAGAHPVAVVQHPGSRPRPFLRPAFDANIGLIQQRIGEAIERGLDREAKKSAGIAKSGLTKGDEARIASFGG